ncbi:hypothetical protein FRC03_012036 [Tulasnella sp. 419]|nr:hypothetical protein FRC03_012036 [Tulasnella sp. 419]
MEEQNELMIEIMHSMLDYANQLWIVGVEFGEQVDSVHDALVLMCSTIADMNDMASCNCVVIALEVSFELKNSDGKVLDTFTGSSVSVLRSLTLHVWRHLLLGLLAQAQNAQDNSIFVAHRLPQILKDIGQTHGSLSGTGTLFRLIHGTLPDSESDLEDEDKTDEYSDIDEDDDEDDDLPPLIDFDNGAAFRNTVLRSVVGEIGDEIKPQDSVVKAKGEDKRKREDSGGGSCDGSGIDEAIADDIDNEYYLRLDQMARLHSLVIKYLIDRFKDVPTLEDYILIVSHLPTIQGTLVAHIATMQHTTTSLSESIRILIHEDNTSMLHKLVSQNDHLAFQIPHTLQAVAVYYAGAARPAARALAPSLIVREIRALIRLTRTEFEFPFAGLRDTTKRNRINEILKIPNSEDRRGAIKRWVDSVITPKVDTTMVQPPSPPMDPLDFFAAAVEASFGIPPSNTDDWDPAEDVSLATSDVDYIKILERHRPRLSEVWSGWQDTIAEVAQEDPVKCGTLYIRVWKEIDEAFPFLKSSKVVAEMTSRYSSSRTKRHVCEALQTLSEWLIAQYKVMAKTAKARAAKSASAKRQSTTGKPSSSSSTIVSPTHSTGASANAATASSSPRQETESTVEQVASGAAAPMDLLDIMRLTIPASWIGLDGASNHEINSSADDVD